MAENVNQFINRLENLACDNVNKGEVFEKLKKREDVEKSIKLDNVEQLIMPSHSDTLIERTIDIKITFEAAQRRSRVAQFQKRKNQDQLRA